MCGGIGCCEAVLGEEAVVWEDGDEDQWVVEEDDLWCVWAGAQRHQWHSLRHHHVSVSSPHAQEGRGPPLHNCFTGPPHHR